MIQLQRAILAARLWLYSMETGSPIGIPGNQAVLSHDLTDDISDHLYEDAMRTQYDLQQPFPSIGKDNQILMDALTRAKNVALNLARAGHRVLDISIGSRNARLTISASNRCHMLGGAMIKLARLNGFEEKTMATNIDGVQVEWTTTSKLDAR